MAMSYLLWLHWAPVENSATSGLCTIGENISCFEVNKSVYSQIFGIPLSLLGLLYFVGVFGITWFKLDSRHYALLSLFTIVLLGPSLYLTFIELTVLYKWCLYCEFSKLLMLGIASLAWLQSSESRPSKSELFLSIASALLLAMIIFYIQV
jgi:uncharacterized membrane protein